MLIGMLARGKTNEIVRSVVGTILVAMVDFVAIGDRAEVMLPDIPMQQVTSTREIVPVRVIVAVWIPIVSISVEHDCLSPNARLRFESHRTKHTNDRQVVSILPSVLWNLRRKVNAHLAQLVRV